MIKDQCYIEEPSPPVDVDGSPPNNGVGVVGAGAGVGAGVSTGAAATTIGSGAGATATAFDLQLVAIPATTNIPKHKIVPFFIFINVNFLSKYTILTVIIQSRKLTFLKL
jgi:hypothetical protein